MTSGLPAGGSPLRQDLGTDRPVRQWLPELLTVRAFCTILFRLSQACGARAPMLGYVVKQLNHIMTGADLAWQASSDPVWRSTIRPASYWDQTSSSARTVPSNRGSLSGR